MLPFSILIERMQLVAGRGPQVAKLSSRMHHAEFPSRDRKKIGGKPFRTATVENLLRQPIPERADHVSNVSLADTFR
jgi:hypothetical protein